MEIKRTQIIGLVAGLIIVMIALLFMQTRFFFLILGIGVIIAIIPFVLITIIENREDKEKEGMFLEFARNLVESVKTGTPISKSIENAKEKQYGVLGPHIKKLANQISMGIPLGIALNVFAKDVNNKTVSRAITLIGQAEKSGGDIGGILESVAEAVSTSDKLKKERISVISSLVVQGYIIFFVFMIIILVLQFKIVPLLSNISSIGTTNSLGSIPVGLGGNGQQLDVSNAFFYLLLIQGLFTGLTVGKLAEGTIKAGVKHSFILMLVSFLVSALANLLFR